MPEGSVLSGTAKDSRRIISTKDTEGLLMRALSLSRYPHLRDV